MENYQVELIKNSQNHQQVTGTPELTVFQFKEKNV